jgi:hypothetical protein
VYAKAVAADSTERSLHVARGRSQATRQAQALCRDAAAADDALHEHLAAEIDRCRKFQRTIVKLIIVTGPLRQDLTPENAAEADAARASHAAGVLQGQSSSRIARDPAAGIGQLGARPRR